MTVAKIAPFDAEIPTSGSMTIVAALTGLSIQPPPQSKIETPHGLLRSGITTLPPLYGGGSFSAGGVVGADVVVEEAVLDWVAAGVAFGIVVSGGVVWPVVFEPGEHCAIPKIKVTSTPRTPAMLPTTVQNSARVCPKMRRSSSSAGGVGGAVIVVFSPYCFRRRRVMSV
ncbi:hypothetical protein ACIBCN_43330 [Nocardia sp. NPDC051052]|uniref:hypothetical protein n=1 Tax=Nocardia sp. NPDC051052 TaxID=3364322 RepID=UPI00379158A0